MTQTTPALDSTANARTVETFLYAVQDPAQVTADGGFVGSIFGSALSPGFNKTVFLITTSGQLFCGIACMTSCSRMIWGFARDGGIPAPLAWVAGVAAVVIVRWSAGSCGIPAASGRSRPRPPACEQTGAAGCPDSRYGARPRVSRGVRRIRRGTP